LVFIENPENLKQALKMLRTSFQEHVASSSLPQQCCKQFIQAVQIGMDGCCLE